MTIHHRLRRPALLLLLTTVSVAAVHAAQPLATNDADVKAARECEWESAFTRQRAHDAAATNTWSTQVGCGLGLDTELTLAAGRTRGGDAEPSTLWALSGKTGLKARSEGHAGYAFAWWVQADKAAGAPLKVQTWQLTALASQPIAEDWLAHLNLGLAHERETRRTRGAWSLAAEHTWNDVIDLTAEVFGISDDTPSAALGMRWKASKRVVIGLAGTRELGGSPGSCVSLIVTFGF